MRTTKTIRDAVHGDLILTKDEMRLVDTKAFQRLRGIKQLGMSSLVYPSAVHSRFEHSLGTCAMAERILQAVEHNTGVPIIAEDRRVVRSAALLHDITHVPFGHTFEDERRIFERHDRDADRLEHILEAGGLGDELRAQGLYHEVCGLLLKKKEAVERPFRYEVVAGTICADLLDYVRRDAFFCGLNQNFDDRVFSLFIEANQRLALDLQRDGLFRHDALSELVHVLRLRYGLTERVYYHHTKVAAGAMLSKALEMALAEKMFAYPELFELGDESFLHVLRERSHAFPAIRGILEALERRALYKRVYLLSRGEFDDRLSEAQIAELEQKFHFNQGNARTKAESALCRALKLPPGSCIIYCPAAAMALKEARVQVRIDDGAICSLDTLRHSEIEVLLRKHRALWRLSVLLPATAADRFAKAIRWCEDTFGFPNMLPRQSRGQLMFAFSPDESENQ